MYYDKELKLSLNLLEFNNNVVKPLESIVARLAIGDGYEQEVSDTLLNALKGLKKNKSEAKSYEVEKGVYDSHVNIAETWHISMHASKEDAIQEARMLYNELGKEEKAEYSFWVNEYIGLSDTGSVYGISKFFEGEE